MRFILHIAVANKIKFNFFQHNFVLHIIKNGVICRIIRYSMPNSILTTPVPCNKTDIF